MDLQVLDFNCHRQLSESTDKSNSKAVVSIASPTKISYPLQFKDDVETSLPYTLHRQVLPDSWPITMEEPIVILGDSHIVALAGVGP